MNKLLNIFYEGNISYMEHIPLGENFVDLDLDLGLVW